MRINWKTLLDKTLAGVYLINKRGEFIYLNDIVERATRYSKEELYRMNIFQTTFQEDLDKVKSYLERVLSGETVFYEARYVRKDREVRWMWGFSSPIEIEGEIYALGSWIDVTRAKKLENELRNREEFYRALIEESLTPVYIVQNRKILYVNKAFEGLTGYSKEEILGKEFFMIHPEDRELVIGRYLERESGVREIETYSFRIIRKDGKVRWITVRPSKINLNGKPAVAATVLDTTEIHELNVELKKRAEYLSLLNSILRHDIGNALTAISAALELEDEKLKIHAREKVEYIMRLIADIRKLESAIEIIKPINLAEVVKDLANRYSIEVNVQDLFVYANEGLRSVFENIVSNAFLHGGKNVRVVIEAYRNGKWAICRISDNGRGIPDEIKTKIFEKGFSTANRTGMGLFIAKWLIDAYGGKIEVKDNKPSGAIFEIKLPILGD
ncbi:MAG: PAS domain S-box protein [Archaeoglobales archaeon]|nr:PAS domain S-box protein [Archaeoglobales archaeon]